MSRPPLREVLRQLGGEGYVELHEGRGAQVAQIGGAAQRLRAQDDVDAERATLPDEPVEQQRRVRAHLAEARRRGGRHRRARRLPVRR